MNYKKLISILIIFLLLLLNGCEINPEKNNTDGSITVLFVGNSFVYTGNIPEQVRKLAALYGIDVYCHRICPGGATLNQTKEEAIEKMKETKYEFVIFQDYGTRPINEEEDFLKDIKELCDAAKKYGAIPVLYNPAWPNIDQKPDKDYQDMITSVYENAAKINDAVHVNAGDAWVYAYKKFPDISLYMENDYHANNTGAYLTSCVIISTLFDMQVKDIEYYNVYNGDMAVELGQAAWEFVSYYKTNGKSPDEVVSVPAGENERVE